MGSNDKTLDRCCECRIEASYTMIITVYRAIHTTPYEAVFGIKAHRENITNTTDEGINDQEQDVDITSSKNMAEIEGCETAERPAKRQKICQQQTQYNKKIIKQTKQPTKAHFKVDEMVAFKVDRVDKTSPIHPNNLNHCKKLLKLLRTFAGAPPPPCPPGKNLYARHFKGKHGKLQGVPKVRSSYFMRHNL